MKFLLRRQFIKMRVYSIILFSLNFLFWIFIAISYSFVRENPNSIVKFLLFLEPIIFLIAFIGYLKRNIIIYYLTLIFLFCNAILSITDEIGCLDILSLILNLLLFIVLAFQWRIFRRNKII